MKAVKHGTKRAPRASVQYLPAAYRAELTRAQDCVIQLYFSASFWSPKNYLNES